MSQFLICREINEGVFTRQAQVAADNAYMALRDFIVHDSDSVGYFVDGTRFIVINRLGEGIYYLFKLSVPPQPKWDVVSA